MKTKTQKKTPEQRAKERLEFLCSTITRNFAEWMRGRRKPTLRYLHWNLTEVQGELEDYDEETLLADILDELFFSSEYVNSFARADGDEQYTVGYRLENVREDLEQVEELIEHYGADCLLKDLKPKRITSQLAIK